jgi:predicted nucleic acid-binding Zn finger protein
VTFTINADDPRTIRAIEIAAEAAHWLSGHNAQGEEVFAVPSQAADGRYYIVTRDRCDCPDYANREADGSRERACKHILAVRLHTELLRAQQQPAMRRRHLSVVPRAD